ncbi:hypothetical protein, partial [Vibrio ordalii]|uniref:hypothetical protein n=1 Tax=Vibrio ordalii TaxID=28174 RepID=UPI001A7E08A7
ASSMITGIYNLVLSFVAFEFNTVNVQPISTVLSVFRINQAHLNSRSNAKQGERNGEQRYEFGR